MDCIIVDHYWMPLPYLSTKLLTMFSMAVL